MKIDWEKAADSLAADMRRQKAEIARMRPVFMASMSWFRRWNMAFAAKPNESWEPVVRSLYDACTKAARKAKGKTK